MQTLGIMQHHDVITGTHKHYVGQDYSRMMREGREEALNISSINRDTKEVTKLGPMQGQIMKDAKYRGIDIQDQAVGCKIEGNAIVSCEPSIERGHAAESYLISVYNPNIKQINGLILKSDKSDLNKEIEKQDGT